MRNSPTAVACGVVVSMFLLSGCNAYRTTLWPYSKDEELDAMLAARAAAACSCRRAGADLPQRRFTSDGCSMSRDGNWVGCCVRHDILYWCGGSEKDRVEADDEFARCVDEDAGRSRALARAMRCGVRTGGGPRSPFPWRWGYGWSEIRGYDAADLPGGVRECLGAD